MNGYMQGVHAPFKRRYCGRAVSSEDGVFEIRDLLRLAMQRMRAGQVLSDPEPASGGEGAEDAQNGAGTLTTE